MVDTQTIRTQRDSLNHNVRPSSIPFPISETSFGCYRIRYSILQGNKLPEILNIAATVITLYPLPLLSKFV